MLRAYSRLREDAELLFWILHKIMEILCFSAKVYQCNIAFSAVYVQVCSICVFVLLVGFRELKITTARPILKIMFKNILRTFEVEILKNI